ncbi:tRNA (N(6)-L-threonylcarbamoyladenosine(37)-C(2))-methylthiotransferase MtaB [Haloplasma contractile]|uniref:Threonylcarbamoyladenosine tRNA methylthiotransferase MtaB n=1 Tax=Haloplasma contractile SSD-17B TaxID=1033810 RepID=U2FLP5_9MOLU|nr:tRNA (N(6)-L-threonylcarbamoyladenosine(37)-C(2))-methylthiotransferase MtaB [Haloplasma contractile]ERJ13675.1 1-deoxy-D-xylulose-5-phosphate reductoisomerase protein [Haloplasma contractile SSD-17B]
MATIAFHTLGCKVNYYETEGIWELFKKEGYEKVDFKEQADVYVINTCTVTNTGDSKSRKEIRRAIRRNPDAVICVTGCYAQTKPNDIEEIDGVDLIIGTNGRDKIIELVNRFLKERQPITYINDVLRDAEFEDLDVNSFSERTRATLKIQEGCNKFCTFCIIPYARGRMRSKKPERVVSQIQQLVDNGHLEVVLTGIHTGGYGIDFEDYDLADLINDIEEKVVGIKKIRISSIEINQLDDKMLDVIKNSKILAKHLHIPLQSGCDTVLKRMNRKYNTSEYLAKIKEIRDILPDIAITTDVIVGFPGESDKEFKDTYDFIEQIQFSELHVFPYSMRTGTKASKMKQQVRKIEKSLRVNELISLSNKLAEAYVEKFKGASLDVIFEEIDKENSDYVIGHTTNYIKVAAKTDQSIIGQVKKVQLIETTYPIAKGIIK